MWRELLDEIRATPWAARAFWVAIGVILGAVALVMGAYIGYKVGLQ